MKKNSLLIVGVAILLVVVAVMIYSSTSNQPASHENQHASQTPVPAAPKSSVKQMPAHYNVPPSLASLGPTLPPEQFTGITREAYRAAREIPQTLAQLPCYCHCDRGMGHKSLYSCFQDDHGASCSTCMNEALLAYKLEKQQKLTPAQIRDRIVEQFGD